MCLNMPLMMSERVGLVHEGFDVVTGAASLDSSANTTMLHADAVTVAAATALGTYNLHNEHKHDC